MHETSLYTLSSSLSTVPQLIYLNTKHFTYSTPYYYLPHGPYFPMESQSYLAHSIFLLYLNIFTVAQPNQTTNNCNLYTNNYNLSVSLTTQCSPTIDTSFLSIVKAFNHLETVVSIAFSCLSSEERYA